MGILDQIKLLKEKNEKKKTLPNYQLVINAQKEDSRNIIYILPGHEKQSGGDKVTRNHSCKINGLKLNQFNSQILYPFNINSKPKGLSAMNERVAYKKDLKFNQTNDFVVIPEYMAAPSGNRLAELGVKYAIFVQGGYIMNTPLYLYSREELDEAYRNASIILSISDDTTENIKTIYPDCADKILRTYLSVDSDLFVPDDNKKNWITYMPRRLNRHAKLIQFFLESNLPNNWQFVPIENMNEGEVAKTLAQSKIFLSLSELEGFGLPPLEAGLAGNYVLGYTGQGGKEFWQAPIFTEIQNGDIKQFCDAILNKIQSYDQVDSSALLSARTDLAKQYSDSVETDSLLLFVNKVNQALNS